MPKRTAMLLMVALAMTGCATWGDSGTASSEVERRLCKEWLDSLPTASTADTEQTKQEVADAATIQRAACLT